MMIGNIVHVLTYEAQTEHNPYKWELALMIHRMQQQAASAQPAPALAAATTGNAAATPEKERRA